MHSRFFDLWTAGHQTKEQIARICIAAFIEMKRALTYVWFQPQGRGVCVCVCVCVYVCVFLRCTTRWHILMNPHQQLVLDDTQLGTKGKEGAAAGLDICMGKKNWLKPSNIPSEERASCGGWRGWEGALLTSKERPPQRGQWHRYQVRDRNVSSEILFVRQNLDNPAVVQEPASGEVDPNLPAQTQRHTLFLASHKLSLEPADKIYEPPELQFIHSATGSRTVRQVVNKGHGFVLSTDKKENKGFFFHYSFVCSFCCWTKNNLLAECCRSWCETATAPRLKRLFDFIIGTQTGEMTWNKENKMQIERRVE